MKNLAKVRNLRKDGIIDWIQSFAMTPSSRSSQLLKCPGDMSLDERFDVIIQVLQERDERWIA